MSDILSRNYRDRQKIVVVQNEFDRKTKYIELFSTELLIKQVGHTIGDFFQNRLRNINPFALPLDIYSTIKETDDFLILLQEEVDREIQFPMGPAIDGGLYIGHPHRSNIYFPAAEFHRCLFDEKIRDVTNLLSALGATSIDIEFSYGWSEERLAV